MSAALRPIGVSSTFNKTNCFCRVIFVLFYFKLNADLQKPNSQYKIQMLGTSLYNEAFRKKLNVYAQVKDINPYA